MAKYSLMPDQQKLVEEHLYLVEIAVKQYVHAFGRTPGIEWDDLYQTGCLALCNAAHCYNPEFPFPPYASKAIRNALHDYCRRQQRGCSKRDLLPYEKIRGIQQR